MTTTTFLNNSVLRDRIREWAKKVGRASTRPVLLLYFVMKSKDTPWSDKALVMSAISYLVLPIDILDAEHLPIIGWIDEIASISVVYKKVSKHITPEIEAKVDTILDKWFPEYAPYVELPSS